MQRHQYEVILVTDKAVLVRINHDHVAFIPMRYTDYKEDATTVSIISYRFKLKPRLSLLARERKAKEDAAIKEKADEIRKKLFPPVFDENTKDTRLPT